MRTTQLGNTGYRVSILGLGLAALGRPGYLNIGHGEDLAGARSVAALEKRTHQMLDAARAAGMTYVDAARSYGKAEEFLQHYILARDLSERSLLIGSKWGYTYTANWRVEAEQHEVKEHSLPVLRRQIDESRSHLDGHLHLYQIHSATLESGVLENAEVLEELGELRSAGLRIGLTLTGPRQAQTLDRALEIEIDNKPLFDTVQATWNLLEQSVAASLRRAHAQGLGVLIKEPVANGRLTSRNPEPSFAVQRRLLESCARRLGTTIDALAIAAALAQPWTHVVLSGATRVDHLQANLQALEVEWNEDVGEELAQIVELPEQYWSLRSSLQWN